MAKQTKGAPEGAPEGFGEKMARTTFLVLAAALLLYLAYPPKCDVDTPGERSVFYRIPMVHVKVQSGKAHGHFVEPTKTYDYYVPIWEPVDIPVVDTTYEVSRFLRKEYVRYIIKPVDTMYYEVVVKPGQRRDRQYILITFAARYVDTPVTIGPVYFPFTPQTISKRYRLGWEFRIRSR